ncbi:response regulator [Roseovarius dicentrarchi]|uniref:response regulator n=1 Tax=Roseovarius dicentrarchi TaxID=2250573 RepID=UPI000DEAC724|nr:response regulator [Roseovarius dicentrarchi]
MSGKIMIIDAVATNRIVLKVKLSAAHFQVSQAPSGRDALDMVRAVRPDLIIVGAALPDMACTDLIEALRTAPATALIPVVALLPENTAKARVDVLKAGADDVIIQPIDERIMLARLRGLLRQHHALQDMRLNAGSDCAAGFGEAQGGFDRPGRITLLGVHMADAMALRTRLRSACRHQITALRASGPVTQTPGAPRCGCVRAADTGPRGGCHDQRQGAGADGGIARRARGKAQPHRGAGADGLPSAGGKPAGHGRERCHRRGCGSG